MTVFQVHTPWQLPNTSSPALHHTVVLALSHAGDLGQSTVVPQPFLRGGDQKPGNVLPSVKITPQLPATEQGFSAALHWHSEADDSWSVSGGLCYALWDVSQHPGPLPTRSCSSCFAFLLVTTKHISKHCPMCPGVYREPH